MARTVCMFYRDREPNASIVPIVNVRVELVLRIKGFFVIKSMSCLQAPQTYARGHSFFNVFEFAHFIEYPLIYVCLLFNT